jgi:hypothetical protein
MVWHFGCNHFKNYSLDGHSNDRFNRCRIRKTIMGEVISGAYPSPGAAVVVEDEEIVEDEIVVEDE